MIIAIYAVGNEGQFGNKGRLPWGSFPEEIHALKNTLALNSIDTILVGVKTWEGLPQSFKDYLHLQLKAEITFYAPRKDTKILERNRKVVRRLDFSMKEYYENANVAIIGGKNLLVDAYDAGIIDCAYISYVWEKDGNECMEADVVLPPGLYLDGEMPPATVFVCRAGENETHAFVQERHYFGTV